MLVRVLVTRPQPGADRSAERLARLGYSPVLLPLTRIVGLPAKALQDSSAFDAIAVTSANAIRHTPAGLLAASARTPCFAVGAETATAAKRAGFVSVVTGSGNARQLAAEVSSNLPAGASVLYLCGRIRTIGLEDALESQGLKVHRIETYDAPSVSYNDAMLDAALGAEPIDAVLLYSARAAQLFLDLPQTDTARQLLGTSRYVCISAEIARFLVILEPDRIHVASAATENAMMRLLAELHPAPFQGRLV